MTTVTIQDISTRLPTRIFPFLTNNPKVIEIEYKKLCLRFHPDKLIGDNDINELDKNGLFVADPMYIINEAKEEYLKFINQTLEKSVVNSQPSIMFCNVCHLNINPTEHTSVKFKGECYHLACFRENAFTFGVNALMTGDDDSFEYIMKNNSIETQMNIKIYCLLDFVKMEHIKAIKTFIDFCKPLNEFQFAPAIELLFTREDITNQEIFTAALEYKKENNNTSFGTMLNNLMYKAFENNPSIATFEQIKEMKNHISIYKIFDILSKHKLLDEAKFQLLNEHFNQPDPNLRRDDNISNLIEPLVINGYTDYALILVDRYYTKEFVFNKYVNIAMYTSDDQKAFEILKKYANTAYYSKLQFENKDRNIRMAFERLRSRIRDEKLGASVDRMINCYQRRENNSSRKRNGYY